MVTENKRNKEKEMITNFSLQFDSYIARTYFLLKDIEQKTSFLVHLDITYPLIIPSLRGIYLKVNSWRPGRDQDGWNISKRFYDA